MSDETDQLPRIGVHLDVLRGRLRTADGLFVFLDFDGTLAPIADDPDEVELPEWTQIRLQRLASVPGVHVAIISGRSLSDVRDHVDVEGIGYAGNHGLQLFWQGERHVESCANSSRETIQEIVGRLEDELDDIDDAFVENKGVTATVHYREASEEAEENVEDIVDDLVEGNDVKTMGGKQIVEVRPDAEWDKGMALDWFHERSEWDTDGLCSLYVGDDETDEDAFAALGEGDFGIKVGQAKDAETGTETNASYRLPDVSATSRLLGWLYDFGVEYFNDSASRTDSPRLADGDRR